MHFAHRQYRFRFINPVRPARLRRRLRYRLSHSMEQQADIRFIRDAIRYQGLASRFLCLLTEDRRSFGFANGARKEDRRNARRSLEPALRASSPKSDVATRILLRHPRTPAPRGSKTSVKIASKVFKGVSHMATIITITDRKIKIVSGLTYSEAVDAGKDFQNETGPIHLECG